MLNPGYLCNSMTPDQRLCAQGEQKKAVTKCAVTKWAFSHLCAAPIGGRRKAKSQPSSAPRISLA
jgi:hypothetical protein